jgi:hypothetical protein
LPPQKLNAIKVRWPTVSLLLYWYCWRFMSSGIVCSVIGLVPGI